jgi:hypothetical protein
MAGAPALSLAMLAAAVVTAPAMQAETDKLLAATGAVRHIAPQGTLERRLVTRDEATAARDEAAAASAGAPELAARARLMQRLGLLPAGTEDDLARLAARALDEAPTASYDAVARRLSVPDWIPLADQRTALAHAVAHALADQRFGVRDTLHLGLDGRHGLDGDAERACLALVEGDATTTALELLDPRSAFTGGHALAALAMRLRSVPDGAGAASPAWLRATSAFIHADGLLFVGHVRGRASWRAVDALWADPPQSSEQVLHPEKYDALERPVPVTLPKLRPLGEDWRAAGSDVLGELGVRTWLEATASADVAARAAQGWGGDRATLFVPVFVPVLGPGSGSTDADAAPPAGPFAVWLTTWDDPSDAEDFARTATAALAQLAHEPEAPLDDAGRSVVVGADGVFALARRGSVVALLVGAPESALPALDELLPAPAKRPAARTKVTTPAKAPAP